MPGPGQDGDAHDSQLGIECDRRRSATSAGVSVDDSRTSNRRRSYTAAGIYEADVSALSVEVAVAAVQQQQQQQQQRQQQEKEQQQQQQQRHQQQLQQQLQQQVTHADLEGKKKSGGHRRSRSMISRVLTPVLGGSSASSSARGSRMASVEERTRRSASISTIMGRTGSVDRQVERVEQVEEGTEEKEEKEQGGEEQEEEDNEQHQHQKVLRRHEPRRSVPSVIDLFGAATFNQSTPAEAVVVQPDFSAREPSPSGAPSAYISAGDLAASLHSPEIWRRHHDHEPSPVLIPSGATYPAQYSPPTAYRDESSAEAAVSLPPIGGTPRLQLLSPPEAGRRRPEDSSPISGGRSRDAAGNSFASHLLSHDESESQQQQQQQQQQPGRRQDHLQHSSVPGASATPPGLAAYGKEPTYQRVACDRPQAVAGSLGVTSADFFTAPHEVDLYPARHLREASTITVDARREGERVDTGAAGDAAGRSAGYQLHEQEGAGGAPDRRGGEFDDSGDLNALEDGVGPIRRSTADTAQTMSQSGSPTSNFETLGDSGGGRSRGAASVVPSRGGSATSSYANSVGGVDGRGGAGGPMRRPSARLQNEAKHFSEQKRGVTTSYKSEELYMHFRKISRFLVVMGIVIGLGSHGIDEGIEVVLHLGEKTVDKGGALLGGGSWARFFFFWLYDILLTGVAAMLTAYFSPGVEGSGIPAMKYMMDTDDVAKKLFKSFTIMAVVVKASGLILAAGGGLNIGREGPYTHLGGMVAYQLIRNVPFFNDILKKETVLRQVLAASVAVGLSSTFAATIGGVLFSIEITTLYYDVGNYFKAFVAAISGTVAVSLVRTLVEGSPEYIERDFSKDEFRVWQYPVFAAMGVLCGFVGPLYVNFRLNMLKLGRKWGKHSIRAIPERRWEYVRAATSVACLAATMTAVLSFFPGEFTRLTPLTTFKELLREGGLADTWSSGFTDNIFIALPVSIVTWIITAAMGTSVTVPSGDFIQTTVIGATVGRLIGEALAENLSESFGVVPSTFALVGAAAMSCGATQTISAAVVIMEMTGSFDLDKPVLLAAVVACGFSRQFGLNIYDSVMRLNGLESLYGLDMRRSEEMTAKDIMETDLKVVPCETTIGHLLRLLQGDDGGLRMFESFPVVTGLEGMAFVGTISRKDLVHIVLTGGSHPCSDSDYMDFVIDSLPKKDVSESWDRFGDALPAKDKSNLFARLPDHVKQAVEAAPGAANTVRALKLLGDRIGSMASDLSFLRGGGSTFGRGKSGRAPGMVVRSSRDPRDRDENDTRLSLRTLWKANWNPDILEDPFGGRPVNITAIAQRATGDVQIDRSVWKAHENMPLKNVYLLFANLRCIRLFIISGDRLTGIISRSILFNAMSNREGPVALNDGSKGQSDRSRNSGLFAVSARKKKRWVDIFLGERSRRGPRQGF